MLASRADRAHFRRKRWLSFRKLVTLAEQEFPLCAAVVLVGQFASEHIECILAASFGLRPFLAAQFCFLSH